MNSRLLKSIDSETKCENSLLFSRGPIHHSVYLYKKCNEIKRRIVRHVATLNFASENHVTHVIQRNSSNFSFFSIVLNQTPFHFQSLS